MTYIEEATKRSVKLVHAIDSDPDITPATKRTTQDYLDFMRARGLTDRTIQKNLYCLSNFYKVIGRKDVLKLTKDDVMKAMAQIERTKYSVKTKQNIKIVVRLLFKHFLGNDDIHPEPTRWIKATIQENKRILPEDLLTEEEVLKLLNVTSDVRDKALIALIYDSGMRVGELLNLAIKDVDLTDNPGHVVVNGKTGMRRIPIMVSAPYLSVYLSTLKDKKRTDHLWNVRGSWSNLNHPLDRAGVNKVLHIAAQKAGIQKAVNPHAFRHARATYYADKLTEQQLKMLMGWTADSRMASTYVHLSGRDLDDSVLEINGEKPKEPDMPKLKTQICPRCRETNGADVHYCGKCGSPLTIETALQHEQDMKNVGYALGQAIQQGNINEAIEGLSQLILKVDYERKQRKRR